MDYFFSPINVRNNISYAGGIDIKMIRIIGYIIVTILIITFVLWGIGKISFNRMIKQEKAALFNSKTTDSSTISLKDLNGLPELLKNHLIQSHVLGTKRTLNMRIKQKGKIKVDRNKDWMPFTATQYFSSLNPGFIWNAKIFPIYVRDKFLNNKGEVKVSFLGLKTIAVAAGKEVNQGSLLRYLGELVWFPSGLLDKRITWTERDAHSLNAVLTVGDLSVTGVFYFNREGLINRFEAKRYFESNGKYTLEDWSAILDSYSTFDGILLPNRGRVIWNLKEGDFEYFNFEVVDYKMVVSIN